VHSTFEYSDLFGTLHELCWDNIHALFFFNILGEQMLGLTHSALRYLLEQFPGASKATKYQWQHQPPPQVSRVKGRY
jgi:hypothetical protein